MNILVTGASGFIGKNVTEFLRESGHTVYGSTTSLQKTSASTKDVNAPSWWFDGKYKNIGMLEHGLKKYHIDTIIHLSADSAIASKNPDQLISNVEYTKNLLEACNGQKVILASTVMMYGNYGTGIKPDSDYSLSKLLCEQLLNYYLEKGKIGQAISLRMCGVLGPGLHKGIVHKIWNTPNPVKLYGHSPGGYLYFLDFEDYINGVLCCLDYTEQKQDVFNLVPESNISVEKIADLAGKEVIWSDSGDNRTIWVSNLDTSFKLNWFPKYNSQQAVERYFSYLNEHNNENLLS